MTREELAKLIQGSKRILCVIPDPPATGILELSFPDFGYPESEHVSDEEMLEFVADSIATMASNQMIGDIPDPMPILRKTGKYKLNNLTFIIL